MLSFTISPDTSGQRLDAFLTAALAPLSRAAVQRLVKAGAVTVNETARTPHYALREGDVVVVTSEHTPSVVTPMNAPEAAVPTVTLVDTTPSYIIVEKPAGLVVHPDGKHTTNTLIQQVVAQFPDIARVGDNPIRPGLVHRLDRDVSGLLVIARTSALFDHLKSEFAARHVQKEYTALVHGRVTQESGTIDFPIGRAPSGKLVARPKNQTGQVALTEYRVVTYYTGHTLLAVTLRTGRTHQIRVHCQALGHPIVGDTLHRIRHQKPDTFPLHRLFLHATRLGFHDLDGEYHEYSSPLPAELTTYLTQLKAAKE